MTLWTRRRLLKIGQWTVALLAFAYVALGIEWGAAAAELATLDPLVIVAIAGVSVVGYLSQFSMWYVLLRQRTPVTFETCLRIDLVLKFLNHLIPSKVSGHSIAPLVLRHYTDSDWPDAVTIAGLNTGLYATVYGIVALLGVALFATRLPVGILVVVVLSTAAYALAGVVVLLAGRRMDVAGRLVGRLQDVLGRLPRIGYRLADLLGRAPTFTADSAAIFRQLSARPSVLGPYVLGVALAIMIVPGIRVGLLLTGLGGSFEPVVLLPVVLVMAYSVTILPLTPGGVGVAEASATLVLVSLGVDPELAGVVVLLDRTFGVYLPAVLGWLPVADLDLATLLVDPEDS